MDPDDIAAADALDSLSRVGDRYVSDDEPAPHTWLHPIQRPEEDWDGQEPSRKRGRTSGGFRTQRGRKSPLLLKIATVRAAIRGGGLRPEYEARKPVGFERSGDTRTTGSSSEDNRGDVPDNVHTEPRWDQGVDSNNEAPAATPTPNNSPCVMGDDGQWKDMAVQTDLPLCVHGWSPWEGPLGNVLRREADPIRRVQLEDLADPPNEPLPGRVEMQAGREVPGQIRRVGCCGDLRQLEPSLMVRDGGSDDPGRIQEENSGPSVVCDPNNSRWRADIRRPDAPGPDPALTADLQEYDDFVNFCWEDYLNETFGGDPTSNIHM